MVRTARHGGGLVALGLALALVGATGCGGKGKSGSPAANAAALHFLSTPVHNAEVGGTMQYQAALSEPGDAEWIMAEGPHGATIQQGGQLTWTPDESSSGAQAFKIVAMVDGHMVEQSFDVTASNSILQASAHVDPSNPNGGSVSVDQPLSEVHGAALQFEPGALPAGDPVTVSISSMQHPPVPPDTAMIAGVDPHDIQPVELHPSGLAFQKPVRLQLPIGPSLRAMPNLTVKTYDYGKGQWTKVKVLNMDKTSGVIVAEVHHFSPYVVTPDVKIIDLSAGLGGAACGASVVVQAKLIPTFAEVPAAVVNGWTGTGSTLADVLHGLDAGQALQVYTRVKARALGGAGDQSGWLLATASKREDGNLSVTVATNSHAGAFLKIPMAGMDATDPELLAWMNGSRADLVFGGLGDVAGGVALSAEVSLYIVSAADSGRPPPASANALGTEDTEVKDLVGVTSDGDCDGAPNAWDPTPAGASPPVLVGFPGSPAHVAVGSPAPFKISSPQDGVTFTWKASDSSVTVVAGMGGTIGTATPSVPGLFTLTVTGALAGATAQFSWDVIADPADVAGRNKPPVVAVTSSANIVRVGEPVTLMALGKDPEQAALTFLWAPSDVTTLSATVGDTTTFKASAPGDYLIGCVASDGTSASAPVTVTLTVLSATANRPPGVPSVTPLASVLTHTAGQGVSLMLTAKADDPDGDTVTYDFAAGPATPPTFTLSKSGAGAAFTTTQDGAYIFYVTATDSKGAVGPWTPVKILVLPPISGTPIDADKDGYPAGFDCNDGDATVHPGAKEICGDQVDQDCDGVLLAGDDCDVDGDRFSKNQGDCDDTKAAIGPQMLERCDGVDNNCDKNVDEGLGTGVDCTTGVGACGAAGKTVCSASYVGVVCGAAPGKPAAETCDGKDNDCNGRVDDLAGTATGDVANCGGCNVACPTPSNSVPSCVMGGCVSTCAAGFVDTDRVAANGCECQLSNNGVEICDGKDNDCNGVADDGVAAVVYAGDPTTMGVGVCGAGIQRCVNGELVQVKPATTPTMEVCDGLDNNCDKKVDETFDLMNDAKNCGGCGIVCAAGMGCQQGRCPGGTVTPDGGVMAGDGGAPLGNLGICKDAAGASICVNLNNDRANCGACGNVCAAGQFCGGGACTTQTSVTCAAGQVACVDRATPEKMFCATSCPAMASTSKDAGAAMASAPDGGAAGCPATAPSECPNGGGGTYCTNFLTDANNCNTCGHVCPAGQGCQTGVCMTPGVCGSGLTLCGTECTSLLDDPQNCMTCNQSCDGTCSNGACFVNQGAGVFASTCSKNNDCSGGFCVDMPRFMWPGGFCSSICDTNRPCPTGQACAGSPTSGAFGFCRKMCTADAECGAVRGGYLCSAGTCMPDCRQGSSCGANLMCDATGHCVPGTAPTCVQPQVTCRSADGATSVCTDPLKDPNNCGGCGRVCAAGAPCNAGVCGSSGNGLAVCVSGGASTCASLPNDPNNCGACGVKCPAGQGCFGGVCGTNGGPTSCPATQKLCTDMSGTKTFCANIMGDPGNCGACNLVCGATAGCFNGQCMANDGGTATTCAGGQTSCNDQTGKPFCTNLLFDPNNCMSCGHSCGGGFVCMGGACMPPAGADGGAAPNCPATMKTCIPAAGPGYCADITFDTNNCGMCFNVCSAGFFCSNATCIPQAAQQDAGTAQQEAGPGIKCVAPQTACDGTYCADFMSDKLNCGACHVQCAAGDFCSNGVCTLG